MNSIEQLGHDLKTGPMANPLAPINGRLSKKPAYAPAKDHFPVKYAQPWMNDPSLLPKRPPNAASR